MTIKELIEELKQYDENTELKIAHYGMKGIITEHFSIDIVAFYDEDEKDKHILLG